MGDFTDLVCIGRIYSQTSLDLEIFSPTYNGVRFFFSIVRHERYFFQCRIFFSQEFICILFLLSKSVCKTFFYKITHNPLKSQIVYQTFGQLTDSDLSKGFETKGDETLQGTGEKLVSTYPYPESPYGRRYGRTYGDVIIKFSPMDSLPNFITHGAPLRALRAESPL